MCQDPQPSHPGQSSPLGTSPNPLSTDPSSLGTVSRGTWVYSQNGLIHHIKDAKSSLEAFQTIKKNFHISTQACQLELLVLLVKLYGVFSPAHFNQFFLIFSELAALSVDIPQEFQGIFLQVLTAPPLGTTKTHLKILLLAAAEKSSSALGPWDLQVIYNSVQAEGINGDGTSSNPFQVNHIGVSWGVSSGGGPSGVGSGCGGGLICGGGFG